MRKLFYIFIFFFTCLCSSLQAQEFSLNGEWSFALDPLSNGEIMRWHEPWKYKENDSTYAPDKFDKVTVPHCWSTDVRYNFVGKGWYRKAFKLATDATNKLVRLKFEAVFYKCRIFVNGELAGFHTGGYTPFTVNITKYVKYDKVNFIAVEVDNSWSTLTIPGARLGDNPSSQFFPWYEYGGITRDVALLVSEKIYIKNQKIEAVPNLKTGEAKLTVITWVENRSLQDATVSLKSTIKNRQTKGTIEKVELQKNAFTIKPFTTEKIVTQVNLNAKEVMLWHFDNPNLYDIATDLVENNKIHNQYETYFGIREFKVSGTELHLNGQPIRVAGSNRQSDHPVYGSTEPEALAKIDMELQRNGNMIFARMNHTPVSKHFIKWADEHGYLLINETPNWQISPVLMVNQQVKDDFKSQLTEMVEAFWNSPSIVGYSAGNEYASWTGEGDEWTREQLENYKQLDSTRLLTFVAIGTALSANNLGLPHDSFRYCDFLNFNNYSAIEGLEKNIDALHAKYPNKPIFISETGMRSDEVKNEQVRIDHLKGVVNAVKKRSYVVGFSYWSFNDYLSRYAGSNKNGYRPWGIVDANRNPRELYTAFKKELSPVTVVVQKNKIVITSNSDFPSYVLINYSLKIVDGTKVKGTFAIDEMKLGSSKEINIGNVLSKNSKIIIENKQGMVVYDSSLK